MKGNLIQGQSNAAAIIIQDASGETVDPGIFQNVLINLVNTSGYSTLAKYSIVPLDGYLEAEVVNDPPDPGGDYILIRFSAEETKNTPVGNIEVQVHVQVADPNYTDGHITSVWKGKLARLLRAKRVFE